MNPLLEIALTWQAAGYTPAPVRTNGTKAPIGTWGRYVDAPATADDIRHDFTTDTDGIGLICGAGSRNLEMFEVEGRAIHLGVAISELMADNGLKDLWARINSGYVEASPSGGIHWHYTVSDGPARPNTKLASRPATPEELEANPEEKRKVLIETRGQGGFTIIAPSNGRTHPTGKPWAVLVGTMHTIPAITSAERDALYIIASMLDQMPALGEQDRKTTTPRQPGDPLRPGDDYNARASWAHILTGWKQTTRFGRALGWTRPGKDARAGISATTGRNDADNLYVFSTSTVFEAETPYSKFGAYTLLNHHGDYRAAAKALAAAGYGDQPKPATSTPAAPFGAIDAIEAVEHPEETSAQRARRLFPRLDWDALWADDDEEEWVHEPLLPARRSVAIYSAPKVGKSLLMLEMAVAISRAEAFLGYTPARRFRVLYVDFENDPKGDVRTRLQAMGYKPADLDHLDYLSFPTIAGFDTERGALELMEAVKAYGSEVVMVDTVSRAVEGEENSNDTWLAMYRHTGLRLKQAGVAIVRLDHSGKNEDKGTRGGSAKSGDVDAIWKLTAVTEDRLRLECTSSRMSIPSKSLLLTRRELPRLHHGVDAIFGVSDHQAKTAAIVRLCDTNELPAEASRDTVRELIKSRGMKVSNAVIQAVVKIRKTVDNPVDSLTKTLRSPPSKTDAAQPDSAETVSDDQTLNLSTKSPDREAPVTSGQAVTVPLTADPPLFRVDRGGHPVSTPPDDPSTCDTCGGRIEEKRVWAGITTCLSCREPGDP